MCELIFVNNNIGWAFANILAGWLNIKFSIRKKVNKNFQLSNDYFWSRCLFFFNGLSWLHSQKQNFYQDGRDKNKEKKYIYKEKIRKKGPRDKNNKAAATR